ncbi:hypothetical protein [Futiania mangrovi]|uniref:Ribbon-helix-helix protein, CopG family n=1 Tax=Futiania mangrovi TaxID=2959716 RepID=A0A9J6PAA6_9PROT|nr:hypothetical protein [Futiania mangrovii]MCP1334934.1 hypothetical protein [Futiania mangrovii]
MARNKFATLHSGLLVRKGEAEPAPPPALSALDMPAQELGAENMRGRKGIAQPHGGALSPGLSRLLGSADAAAHAAGPDDIDAFYGDEEADAFDEGADRDEEATAQVHSIRDILARQRRITPVSINESVQRRRDGTLLVTVPLSADELEKLRAVSRVRDERMSDVLRQAVVAFLVAEDPDA